MVRPKWLGGRLDTLVTDENETDEYLTFSIGSAESRNKIINPKIIVVKDTPYIDVKRFKP